MKRTLFLLIPFAWACSSSGGNGGAAGAPNVDSVYSETTPLDVAVPASGRVYVRLAAPELVAEDAGDWDLAFEGYEVFTNSGPSGSGKGEAFGQLDILALLDPESPAPPFTWPDKAGGAFLDWYEYDGKSHGLFGRYHVYGVRRDEQLWKVQILSYYSEQDNTAVSGLYRLRYARLAPEPSVTEELEIDGTAGGLSGGVDSASGCLDLETGSVSQLTATEARESSDWDLCFRRDSISVNGEVGGPRGVTAADLQAAETAEETLADLQKKTAQSELSRFDAADESSFAGLTFRGDHVVSAFEIGHWLKPDTDPPEPAHAAWLVVGSDGKSRFLTAFERFENPTATSPGTIALHVKPVSEK